MKTLEKHKILFEVMLSYKATKLFFLTLLVMLITLFYALMLVTVTSSNANAATSRVKDIVTVEGIRDNILIGYGLVVGLNGTGDKLNNSIFTEKSLQAFLERLGVGTNEAKLKAKNVAAVTVTATLPPFARSGSKLDVAVSTLGDSSSLMGGTLIATPLRGADGEIYALAQGAVSIGGFEASDNAGNVVSKGVPTTGAIANGAIIEREIAFDLNSLSNINLALRNPDITTARRVTEAINKKYKDIGNNIAVMRDPGTVEVNVPKKFDDAVAMFLSDIEYLEIQPDQKARVIIDEASGTIVMNENVRLDTVAIAQGNLVVRVSKSPLVSQPNPLAPEGAETVATEQTEITVTEDGSKLTIMDEGASLRELVSGLNALGVGPRDLITILQTIKVAGALQADIEMR